MTDKRTIAELSERIAHARGEALPPEEHELLNGPCPICDGTEGCSHSVSERIQAAMPHPAPKADPDQHEQFTCATAHLAAERALRIIERATMMGEVMNENDIYALKSLCDEAGVNFCRQSLKQGEHPF